MLLWLAITKNEQDCLRLYQQTNYPGTLWTEPQEPTVKKNLTVEEESDMAKEMSKPPHPVGAAWRK